MTDAATLGASCLTIAEFNKLQPCPDSGRRVRALLRKVNSDEAHCFSAAEARDAGCIFADIVWVATSIARNDKAIERKLRLWMSDCAARVLHIYERDHPTDERVRNAIKASRDFANGKIRAAAWAAARAVANAAAFAAGAAAHAAAHASARAAARASARAAANAAAHAAAHASARDAEEQFQFDRLILWLSDDEPRPLRLPTKPKIKAERKVA